MTIGSIVLSWSDPTKGSLDISRPLSASADVHCLHKCSVVDASKTISDQDNEWAEIKLRELCDNADSY